MVWHRVENLEVGLQVLFQIHNGGYVTAAVTIVGGRPDGDDVLVLEMILRRVSTCNIIKRADGQTL